MEEKIFKWSILVSFLFHLVALGSLLYANVKYPYEERKRVEVVYQIEPEETEAREKVEPRKKTEQEELAPAPEILEKESAGPSPMFKEVMKPVVKIRAHEKQFSHMASLDGKRHVSVPLLKSEKITNPQYLSYHELIRNKIKNRAYFYIDSPDFQAGEVYLTFVVSSQGTLEDLKIIEAKTSANAYLRDVGLKSIKESSPFPPFPQDLTYPELSFNVIISFEVDK